MKPVLIVKLGSTFPSLAARQGDFEQWVAARLGLSDSLVQIVDPGDLPADPATLAGAVLTGSHAMVTDGEAWSRRAGAWLRTVVEAGLPVLGICYGHQLLAEVFGGTVGPNPAGREFGTVEISLTPEACDDELFGGLGATFAAQTCHTQSVLTPPPEAVVLARSAMDACHAFRIGSRAWGVQFHPEFDEEATRFYVEQFRETLTAEGRDVEKIQSGLAPTPVSARLLQRFASLADR